MSTSCTCLQERFALRRNGRSRVPQRQFISQQLAEQYEIIENGEWKMENDFIFISAF